MELNQKMRKLREWKQMTQLQVAEKLHIDKSTYTHYESGRRRPDDEKLLLLSKLFGVSLESLVSPELPITFIEKVPDVLLDRLEEKIKEVLSACNRYGYDKDKCGPEYEALMEALKPIKDMREKKLEVKSVDMDNWMPGMTIKRVLLDERAERLIWECLELQKSLLSKII